VCAGIFQSFDGLIRNNYNSDGDAQVDQKWPQCMGCFVRYNPLTVTSNVRKEKLTVGGPEGRKGDQE
jgi:hypothetical protein